AIASKPAPTEFRGRPRILGTLQNLWELACSRAGDAVSQLNRGAAIASKPAPTAGVQVALLDERRIAL
ncbi:hypothetical protein, partial [Pseudomonas sp. FSL W7-0098]|uniref:hypothetical protein n=1 Tax=Pseudomonas sp. FSL W7-0098 TaxID=2496120 RepID=UPI001EE865CE